MMSDFYMCEALLRLTAWSVDLERLLFVGAASFGDGSFYKVFRFSKMRLPEKVPRASDYDTSGDGTYSSMSTPNRG